MKDQGASAIAEEANAAPVLYTENYLKHVTLANAKDAPQENLKPIWEGLSKTINAWPHTIDMKMEYWNDLVPAYRQAVAELGG